MFKSLILLNFYKLPINIQRSLTFPIWKKKQNSMKSDVLDNLNKFDVYAKQDRHELENNQLIKFRNLLAYAMEHVPYYRERYKGIKVEDIHTYNDISQLPLIDKKIVIENLEDFISDEFKINDLSKHSTGGSTGIPLDLYNTRQGMEKGRDTLFLWDYMGGIYGKNYKSVYIGTAYEKLTSDQRLWGNHGELYSGSFGIHDDCLYMTSMNMTPSVLEKYTRKLFAYKPVYIKGYASGVTNLAKYMKSHGLLYHAKAVLTSSDLLSREDRTLCEEIFRCNIFNHYGQSEDVAAASECGKMHHFHIDMMNCLMETVDCNNEQIYEINGEIVGTNLNNYVMPLIRYKTGDYGAISKEVCQCGNQSWLLKSLIGRVGDRLSCSDGKMINQVDIVELIANVSKKERAVFDSLLAYQIIQEKPSHITLVIQTLNNIKLGQDEELAAIKTLLKIINDPQMECDISYKEVIADHNGKIRKIINQCK